jgi:hypothetical protein
MGDGDNANDHTITNTPASAHDPTIKPPEIEYPGDGWGAEGTWDSSGQWQGGTVHDPYLNVPIPGSLDPAQVAAHHEATQSHHAPASDDQKHHLHVGVGATADAIANLAQSSDPEMIIAAIGHVLAHANATVYGEMGGWDQTLSAAATEWAQTLSHGGTPEQFHTARDVIVNAGYAFVAQGQQWTQHPDAVNLEFQGPLALAELGQAADAAHRDLHVQ